MTRQACPAGGTSGQGDPDRSAMQEGLQGGVSLSGLPRRRGCRAGLGCPRQACPAGGTAGRGVPIRSAMQKGLQGGVFLDRSAPQEGLQDRASDRHRHRWTLRLPQDPRITGTPTALENLLLSPLYRKLLEYSIT